MRSAIMVCVGVCVAAASGGCGGTGQPYVTPERLDRGLVVVLTGIHGRLWLSESICHGLDQGGVGQAVEMCDWTYHGALLPFYNLGAVERNHEEAQRIAGRIAAYQKDHPGRPVTLVGYSGGGPLAVWTAEALPPGVQLEGIVLLSAPLVPEYDLRPALAASRKGIVSFHSAKDTLYLALGTIVFGTMDKQHRVSAGNLGFSDPRAAPRTEPSSQPAGPALAGTLPADDSAPATQPVAATDPATRRAEVVAPTTRPAEDPNAAALRDEVYAKLFQVPWQEEMADSGYNGTHLTIGAQQFIAAYVAPLVRARQWDAELLDAVVHRLRNSRPAAR